MEKRRALIVSILSLVIFIICPGCIKAFAEPTDNIYQTFLNENCICQIPEGNDDYVSVFVDMNNENATGISYQDVTGKLVVNVRAKGNEYETRYSIDDDGKPSTEDQVVFTTKRTMYPILNEGDKVVVHYKFFENGEDTDVLAEKTEEVTVGKALGKTTYSKRALTLTVTPKTPVYTYRKGVQNKSAVSVTAKYNGQLIPPAAYSYKLSYSHTEAVGTATVTLTMDDDGDFTGQKSAKYTVKPREVIIESVTPNAKSYKYTGKYIKAPVTIKAKYKDTGKAVEASVLKDITHNVKLGYENCKNVGTAKVTATMKNNYISGLKSATYTIKPIGTSLSSVTASSKGFTVKWRAQKTKMATSNITGYQIQYSTNKKFPLGKKTKSVNVTNYKKTSKKITKLSASKKYYVRVRTYKTLNGKTYYSGWTAAKKIKTKK